MPITRSTSNRNIRYGTVLVAVSTIWASGETLSMLRRRRGQGGEESGGTRNDDPPIPQPHERRRRKLSTNDEAHKIQKTINICKKKKPDSTEDCGLWDTMFHSDDFDCSDVTFAEAYDSCKGLNRKDYCGCTGDDELVEWVDTFLQERRRKNYVRYGNRPYPAPRKGHTAHGFLELALCLKDSDFPDHGLLCRQCEWWSLKHMAEVCFTSPTALDDYCGCSENALLEYKDRLEQQGVPIEAVARESGETRDAEPKTAANATDNNSDKASRTRAIVKRPANTKAPEARAAKVTRHPTPAPTTAPSLSAAPTEQSESPAPREEEEEEEDDAQAQSPAPEEEEEEEAEDDGCGGDKCPKDAGEQAFHDEYDDDGFDDDKTSSPTSAPTRPTIQNIASGILSAFGIGGVPNNNNNNNSTDSVDDEQLRGNSTTRPPSGAIGGEGSRKHIGGLQLTLGQGGNLNFVASFRNGPAKNVNREAPPKLDKELIEVERKEGDSMYYDWSFHDDDDSKD